MGHEDRKPSLAWSPCSRSGSWLGANSGESSAGIHIPGSRAHTLWKCWLRTGADEMKQLPDGAARRQPSSPGAGSLRPALAPTPVTAFVPSHRSPKNQRSLSPRPVAHGASDTAFSPRLPIEKHNSCQAGMTSGLELTIPGRPGDGPEVPCLRGRRARYSRKPPSRRV